MTYNFIKEKKKLLSIKRMVVATHIQVAVFEIDDDLDEE